MSWSRMTQWRNFLCMERCYGWQICSKGMTHWEDLDLMKQLSSIWCIHFCTYSQPLFWKGFSRSDAPSTWICSLQWTSNNKATHATKRSFPSSCMMAHHSVGHVAPALMTAMKWTSLPWWRSKEDMYLTVIRTHIATVFFRNLCIEGVQPSMASKP